MTTSAINSAENVEKALAVLQIMGITLQPWQESHLRALLAAERPPAQRTQRRWWRPIPYVLNRQADTLVSACPDCGHSSTLLYATLCTEYRGTAAYHWCTLDQPPAGRIEL